MDYNGIKIIDLRIEGIIDRLIQLKSKQKAEAEVVLEKINWERKRKEELTKREEQEEERKKLVEERRAERQKIEEERRVKREERQEIPFELFDSYLIAKAEFQRSMTEKLKGSTTTIIEKTGEGFIPLSEFSRPLGIGFSQDFTGIYIIHNISKNKFYVGQGINVNRRMLEHFTKSKSKNDIYTDFLSGDSFEYKQIKLATSGFDSLHDLESVYIQEYNCLNDGYNASVGNISLF